MFFSAERPITYAEQSSINAIELLFFGALYTRSAFKKEKRIEASTGPYERAGKTSPGEHLYIRFIVINKNIYSLVYIEVLHLANDNFGDLPLS